MDAERDPGQPGADEALSRSVAEEPVFEETIDVAVDPFADPAAARSARDPDRARAQQDEQAA